MQFDQGNTPLWTQNTRYYMHGSQSSQYVLLENTLLFFFAQFIQRGQNAFTTFNCR
jgi:hypothetical protein